MTIYKRSEGDKQLSKNFRLSELMCKCGQCEDQIIDDELIDYLQKLRDYFGSEIRITSAYRCESHNQAVGGVKGSTHTKGMAADMQCNNLEYLVLVINTLFKEYSIGRYSNFVHTDIRKDSRRW